MIDLNFVSGFFPSALKDNPKFAQHIVKEYLQLMVLDFLSDTKFIDKLAFIGGTNLRLVKSIDRFSEDLDFDCKDMTEEEFMEMTDEVVAFLKEQGLNVETKDQKKENLTAFRRNIYFPQLLFDLKLSGHREKRFLMKVEAQDQGIEYEPQIVNVSGCGFFFPLPVPPDSVLLAMKLSALLSRAKGRDFYDAMFLLSRTKPDYEFLAKRIGIESPEALKTALHELVSRTDLNLKKRDFEHLLFNTNNSDRILHFPDFINQNL